MTTTPDTAINVALVLEQAQRVWGSFQPWRDDMMALRASMSPAPIPYSGSARISATSATRLQAAQAYYTAFASGKLQRMRENFVSRMLNGEFKIESREVSDDRAEQARIEDLLHILDGWVGMLDQQVRRGRIGNSWRQLVASSAAFPGSIIALPLLQDRNGKGHVSCEVYDPLDCAYTFADETPNIFVLNKRMGAMTARQYLAGLRSGNEPRYAFPEQARREKPDEAVTVMTVYVEQEDPDTEKHVVYRACFVNGESAGIPQLTPFDRMPHQIMNLHSSVSTYQAFPTGGGGQARGVEDEFIREHAKPFYASLKRMNENFNTVVTTAFAGIAQGLDPALHIRSKRGLDVPEEQLDAGGRVISRQDDELEIGVINQGVAQITQGLEALMRVFQQEYDEVFNPQLFGRYTAGQSGFSQVTQSSHSETVFHQSAAGCMGFAQDVLRELLHQFRQAPDVEFSFEHSGSGQIIPAKSYRVSDLPQRVVLNVEWHADIGSGMERLAAAQQMVALGFPLSEALTRAMNVTNPQELMERAADERARASPLAALARQRKMALMDWQAALDAARRARSTQKKEAMEQVADDLRAVFRVFDAQFHAIAAQAQARGQGQPPGFDNQVLPPPLSGQDPVGDAAREGRPAVGLGGQGGGARAPESGG